jgi:integrase
MAVVRKRTWVNKAGEQKEAWVVDYVDQHKQRHLKTFAKKKEADAYRDGVAAEVRANTHVADFSSKTIEDAAKLWLKRARDELEYGTYVQYRQHADLHIIPFIGSTKLSKLSVPFVRDFLDTLKDEGRSPAMVKAVRTSLSSIISEAQERGLIVRNPVREMVANRRSASHVEKRRKRRLEYGVDIPTHDEMRLILKHAAGRFKPLLMVAFFTGLRSSELRGLRWADVDLEKKQLHVRQRADNYHVIGMPKSESGQRTVPLMDMVVNELREWRMRYPRPLTGKTDADGKPLQEGQKPSHLVFPNTVGKLESHANIVKRGLHPPQIAAELTKQKVKIDGTRKPVLDEHGNEQYVTVAKYEGLHALRHWFASFCINRRVDGGIGLDPKRVQARLGHSTIAMTLDTYGHLFPSTDDHAALEAAEAALFPNGLVT